MGEERGITLSAPSKHLSKNILGGVAGNILEVSRYRP